MTENVEPAILADRDMLTFVRHLPGPIERVWAYLTQPTLLAKWLSDGVVAQHAGGEVRFEMGATGRITAYEPPRLLEYTWNEEEGAHVEIAGAVVRWELAEEGSGVRLTLTHSRLPEVEVLAHGAGWHAFLDRLTACVEGRDPQPFTEAFTALKTVYAPLVRAAGIDVPE